VAITAVLRPFSDVTPSIPVVLYRDFVTNIFRHLQDREEGKTHAIFRTNICGLVIYPEDGETDRLRNFVEITQRTNSVALSLQANYTD
jgi:hypothetical protein